MNNYYIYIYLDPRKHGKYEYGEYCFLYEPFYVGKGKNDRWKEVNHHRSEYFMYKINKIKKIGLEPSVIKLKESINEKNSFILESELISLIGRENLNSGPLINFTNGGEGISGYKHTKESIEMFSKKQRKNFSDVKNEFKRRKYKLLTKEKDYKNNLQKLDYICPNGHKNSIRWNDFQKGHGCVCYKNGEKLRKSFSDVKKEFEMRKCKLQTEEKDYENAFTKLEYKCSRGHKHSIRWSSFQQRKNNYCPKCNRMEQAKKLRKNSPEIKKEFERRNCKLLTEEKNYENCYTKLEYECPKDHKYSISWNNFQQRKNNYCPKCNRSSLRFLNRMK